MTTPRGGAGRGRVIALVLVATVMIGSLAACGKSNELSARDLAAQDRRAAALIAADALQAQRVARQLQARAAAATAKAEARNRSAQRVTQESLRFISVPAYDLCTVERPALSPEQRRAQRLRQERRRLALYYLNLSC